MDSRAPPKRNQIVALGPLAHLSPELRRALSGAGFASMPAPYPSDAWNFVFGQATLRYRVGVFSFLRLDPTFDDEPRQPGDEALVLRRTLKVLWHEMGHIFGMCHCIYFSCLMNGANHLQESDANPMHLCPVCLRKLQFSIRFDVVERYESLRRFYEAAGMEGEAGWVESQLAWIRG